MVDPFAFISFADQNRIHFLNALRYKNNLRIKSIPGLTKPEVIAGKFLAVDSATEPGNQA